MRTLLLAGLAALLLGVAPARAQEPPPSPPAEVAVEAPGEEVQTPDLVDQAPEVVEVNKDRPVVIRSADVEGLDHQIEVDFALTRDRDGSPVKAKLPFLWRIDTGPETELRLQSDFLTWQGRTLGFSDLVLGFKWQFLDDNPSMAVVGMVEFPNGSAGFADAGIEPGGLLTFDYRFDSPWEVVLNAGGASMVDSTSLDRYGRFVYAGQLNYHVTEEHYVSMSFSGKDPDQSPDGAHLLQGHLGFTVRPDPRSVISLTLDKGFSCRDTDWGVTVGWSRKY